MASKTTIKNAPTVSSIDALLSWLRPQAESQTFWASLSGECKAASVDATAEPRDIDLHKAWPIAGKVRQYWGNQLLPAVSAVWTRYIAYILKGMDRLHLVECLMIGTQSSTSTP